MANIWMTIAWVANTLIFMLAGVLIGSIQFTVTLTDIGSICLVYALTQVIRVVMVCDPYTYSDSVDIFFF